MEALASIQSQQYPNYHLIIINDGANQFPPPMFATMYATMVASLKDFPVTTINHDTNQGPAGTKYSFIQYVNDAVEAGKFDSNDIALIIDGDDTIEKNSLFIINDTYNDKKGWCTFGECSGKWCRESTNQVDHVNWENMRKEEWCCNHPRSFKLFLLSHFTAHDFQYQNQWLTKATDRPLMYDIFEQCGTDRIAHIPHQLYRYREHSNNSYKTVPHRDKMAQLNYIRQQPQKDRINENIHIVMCCWNRFQNLHEQLISLNCQTIAKRIHLHLLNNNAAEQATIEGIVARFHDLEQSHITISVYHYTNTHFGFQRFLFIRETLLQRYIVDYVIMIDDDQLFAPNWVASMWSLRCPFIYTGWYCKRWTVKTVNNRKYVDYWHGSTVTPRDCLLNHKPHIVQCHYVGTGGSLVDVNIFKSPLLWTPPSDLPSGISIYNIEDMWLSFIATRHRYTLQRSFLPECLSLNTIDQRSNVASLWTKLGSSKQQLLDHLINTSWTLATFDYIYNLLPPPTETTRKYKRQHILHLLRLRQPHNINNTIHTIQDMEFLLILRDVLKEPNKSFVSHNQTVTISDTIEHDIVFCGSTSTSTNLTNSILDMKHISINSKTAKYLHDELDTSPLKYTDRFDILLTKLIHQHRLSVHIN